MRINNKEWVILAACLLSLIPGMLYFSNQSSDYQYQLKDLNTPKRITIHPQKQKYEELLLKVDGVSDLNYALQLNLFSQDSTDRLGQHIYTEKINIPAGNFSASFKRNLSHIGKTKKAEIVYRPGSKMGKGSIKIDFRFL